MRHGTLKKVLLLFALSAPLESLGGQFNIGAGYGPQSLDNWDSQKNGVVDLSYTFLESKNRSGWQFLCGAGYSYVFTDADQNKDVHIFSVLPSVRYNLNKRGTITPFLEVTIGPSYMSDDQLGDREQGSQFTFNDFFSIGIRFGREEEWEFRYSWRHLSNGDMFKPNPGCDIPFSFHIGKHF